LHTPGDNGAGFTSLIVERKFCRGWFSQNESNVYPVE